MKAWMWVGAGQSAVSEALSEAEEEEAEPACHGKEFKFSCMISETRTVIGYP